MCFVNFYEWQGRGVLVYFFVVDVFIVVRGLFGLVLLLLIGKGVLVVDGWRGDEELVNKIDQGIGNEKFKYNFKMFCIILRLQS